jgi:hypothetical protein
MEQVRTKRVWINEQIIAATKVVDEENVGMN